MDASSNEREGEQVERVRVIGKEDGIVLCALYRRLQKFYGRNTGVFTNVHPHVKTTNKNCYFFLRGKQVLPAVKTYTKRTVVRGKEESIFHIRTRGLNQNQF